MPNTRRHSYNLNFKLKIVVEAEAVNNNREIAREYGISESIVRKWRNQQDIRRSEDDSQARFLGPLPTKRSRTSATVGRLVQKRSQGKQMPSYLIH